MAVQKDQNERHIYMTLALPKEKAQNLPKIRQKAHNPSLATNIINGTWPHPWRRALRNLTRVRIRRKAWKEMFATLNRYETK
jgi:hypothetical protein